VTPPAPGDEHSAQLRSLARGGGLNLVASAAAAVANIGLVLVVTRGLSPVEAGVFFAATSLFVLAAKTATLGTPTGLVYFFSRSLALQRPADTRRWLQVGLIPVVALSTVAAVGLFALAPQAAEAIQPEDPAPMTVFLRVIAAFLPLAALTDALLAATRGTGTMRPSALVEQIARPTLQLVLVLLAIQIGTGVPLAWALPYLPAAVVAWFWLRRLLPPPAEATPADESPTAAPGAGRFWRFTGPRALTGVAQIALQRLDIILVAAILGPAEAAVYTAATRFLVLGQLVGQAFSQAVQPMLGAALAREDLPAGNRLYRTATCWLVLIAWPVYLTFALLAPAILDLFGPGYDSGAPVVVILTLVMLVATGCGMVDTVLNMAGRTTWNLANVLLALGVNVAANLLLIPRLGIEGAAIAWAAAILTNNLLPLAQVGWALRMHPFGRGTLTAMGLATACFGVLPGSTYLLSGNLVWVAAAVALGMLVYLPACWRLRRVLDLTAMLALLPGRRRGPARGPRPDVRPTVQERSQTTEPEDQHACADRPSPSAGR
jgi:O-antigen/teichoic acid export membrane protein